MYIKNLFLIVAAATAVLAQAPGQIPKAAAVAGKPAAAPQGKPFAGAAAAAAAAANPAAKAPVVRGAAGVPEANADAVEAQGGEGDGAEPADGAMKEGQWKHPKHPQRSQHNVSAHGDKSAQCASHQKSYCCNQTVAPDAPGVGILGSLLDNLFIGLECLPININLLAIDETSQCSAKTVCCSGDVVDGGRMVFGCDTPQGPAKKTKL
ncbi:hypothetical protein CXG81DRAFT_18712 [Caulochytrium protostelioides]|uniref:Hydrophobin n=1 Tax=Caulochytrium protostelioides TaxID=1555241 RepID=A0A4P9X8A1_9FUNG|nr:hypothetical protein CXG81DRAFT_18712 [Caulochytrium protostelioides]|eukprot:RKP01488.1 hypothetical protein CXG81DRAFT_18712 [Caulochytrium protostelioides]